MSLEELKKLRERACSFVRSCQVVGMDDNPCKDCDSGLRFNPEEVLTDLISLREKMEGLKQKIKDEERQPREDLKKARKLGINCENERDDDLFEAGYGYGFVAGLDRVLSLLDQ